MSEEEWFHEAMEVAMAASEDEPMMSEALNSDEWSEWSDVINAELTQIEKVNAWVPIIPPPNIIPSHHVFHHKHDTAGNVFCHKAHLVVKGFRQQFGVNYIKTFAPTV